MGVLPDVRSSRRSVRAASHGYGVSALRFGAARTPAALLAVASAAEYCAHGDRPSYRILTGTFGLVGVLGGILLTSATSRHADNLRLKAGDGMRPSARRRSSLVRTVAPLAEWQSRSDRPIHSERWPIFFSTSFTALVS